MFYNNITVTDFSLYDMANILMYRPTMNMPLYYKKNSALFLYILFDCQSNTALFSH